MCVEQTNTTQTLNIILRTIFFGISLSADCGHNKPRRRRHLVKELNRRWTLVPQKPRVLFQESVRSATVTKSLLGRIDLCPVQQEQQQKQQNQQPLRRMALPRRQETILSQLPMVREKKPKKIVYLLRKRLLLVNFLDSPPAERMFWSCLSVRFSHG